MSPQPMKKSPRAKKQTKKPAKADLLEVISAVRTFERSGVEATLDCYLGSQLGETDAEFCLGLLGEMMRVLHASTGGARGTWDSATKSEYVGRLRAPTSRVFIIRSKRASAEELEAEDDWVLVHGSDADADDPVVAESEHVKNLGFLHVQIQNSPAQPALLVLEMQLIPEMRGKGLGKHVMEVVQKIAQEMGLPLVLFNMMKANAKALQRIQQAQEGRYTDGDEPVLIQKSTSRPIEVN